jgi:hypothetical protein
VSAKARGMARESGHWEPAHLIILDEVGCALTMRKAGWHNQQNDFASIAADPLGG